MSDRAERLRAKIVLGEDSFLECKEVVFASMIDESELRLTIYAASPEMT